jgi:lipopolysaccharide/colanic/teichoic acid biosynthesis glycosyltransferase
MRIGAENGGMQWASDDDPRVTKVGKWLRNTHLDELPQIVNIILGQMSIVGPRPERPEFYDFFDTYIVGFRQRTLVVPGLTGYAQVNGGYDLKPEEKIIYDIEYIRNRSLKMDMLCI